jgi:general nucleoside transport system ATP-binding protein
MIPRDSTHTAPRLALHGMRKRYGDLLANDDVSLTVAPGEIHAVLGENGAGKSTLMKMVFGAVQPDAGRISIDGVEVRVRNPHEARALGVAMVFQHLSLFESLSVAQNVWLGLQERVTLTDVTERIRVKAAAYGLDVDPQRPLHDLSVGERQRVEIVRALLTQPRLLILDEPTSVLAPQAVDKLFATLRQLSAEGCSILYISHKLDEIRALCHRCTVLRAGRVTGVVDPRTQSDADLSRLMIGEEPPALVHREARLGEVALSVRNLSLSAATLHGVALRDINLQVRGGEVLGVAGVSGSGQQALLAALSGEDRRVLPGTIQALGQDVSRLGPQARRALGLRVVPEERLGRGAVPSLSLAHNTLLTRVEPVGARGWIHGDRATTLAQSLISRFGVKAAGPQAAARSLSGGNVQKYIVGREIDAAPKVLIVAQPTWGVDVGAAARIRADVLALRDAGCAVLVISESLDELFELADRLVVMAQGRVSPSVPRRDATVATIGAWMAGLFDNPAAQASEAQHAAP